MKKLLIALFIGITSFGYSQCITGGPNITLGQTVVFTSVGTAQCASCYDWDINGDPVSSDNTTVGNIKIVNSDMGQTVSLQGIAAGPFTIQLNYITESGCQQCTFSGNVVDPGCAFTLSNITTVSVAASSVTFQTTPTPSITSGITYTWTATYQDTTTAVLVVNNSGVVTFPSTSANPVVSVCVTANYLTCSASKCLTTVPCNLPAKYTFSLNKVSAIGGVPYLIPVGSWNSNYTYTWTATYQDGSTITTFGTTPQTSAFPGCNNGSNLYSTTLTLCSAICCKTYVKLNDIDWCAHTEGGGGGLRPFIQNPTKSPLQLDTLNLDRFNGVIYDLNGNKVMEFNEKDLPSKDISKLAKKMYIIKIYNVKNEEVYSEKLVVE
jgi:hypothetical protein